MRKLLKISLVFFAFMLPASLLVAQDNKSNDDGDKKEKKECKDDSCKKPDK